MYFDHRYSLLTLNENSIHLWSINPQELTDPNKISDLKEIISTDELNKVEKYKRNKDKHGALVTRAFIRLILSKYQALSPKDWSFSINAHGKPEIKNALLPLRFNLSHNKDLIICAVCLDRDIGCDVERFDRNVNVSAITRRFFSKDEQSQLNELPEYEQRSKFIEYWTLKEAFVKATGHGISLGLDTFSFKINASDTHQLNKNIELTVSEKCKIDSHLQWFNCLIFPDDEHCIALSINKNELTTDFTIQHFTSEDLSL